MRRFRRYGRRRTQRTPTEIQPVFVQAWQDGWLPNVQKTGLPVSSVYDLLNVVWNDDFTISKRHGYTNIATTVTGMATAEFIFAPRVHVQTGLFPQYSQQVLYFNDSNGQLFYNSLGEVWAKYEDALEGSNLIDSTHGLGASSDSAVNRFRVYPVSVVTYEEKIYMSTLKTGGFGPGTNQADPTATGLWETEDASQASQSKPIIYDVGAGTFTRTAVNDLDGVNGGIPGARCMLSKYARIFAGNVYKFGIYRYPSRLYWSGTDLDPTLAETWEALNYIDVGADDGQEITAMVSFADQILVFKNQSIWTLVGTDETTFALYQLDDKLGTEATYAVAGTTNRVYFMDERTGVWMYDGAQFTEVGRPINDKLLGELNREAAYKVSMALHNHLLYVSIPTGTQSTASVSVTYVYNTRLGTWTRWNYGIIPSAFPMFSDLAITGPTVALSNNMFGGRPATGLFMFNDQLNDDGAAISSYVTTPWINPGPVGDRHRLRRLEVLADETDAAVTVDVFKDLEFDAADTSISYNPATGTENVLAENQAVDSFLWSWLCLRFTQNGDDEDMNLFGFGLSLSSRPTPRGVRTGTGYTA